MSGPSRRDFAGEARATERSRLAAPLFDPASLDTPAGCQRAMREVKAERGRLNILIQNWTRSGSVTLTPDEEDFVADLRARFDALSVTYDDLRERHSALTQDNELRFERAFIRAAREALDRAMYDRLLEEAHAVLRADDERRRALGTGAALGVNAGGGGRPRERE
jgi:hypothetical protein